jgi:hypothetical protein
MDLCSSNFLQPSGFKVVISKDEMPNLSFLVQGVSHPSMEMAQVDLGYKRTGISLVGDNIEFGEVTFEVILDEDMKVYGEIYAWMERLIETNHQLNKGVLYRSSDTSLSDYQDVRLKILTSSNNGNKEFVYRNAFPTSLGSVEFASTGEETFITCPITFKFDYFEFI